MSPAVGDRFPDLPLASTTGRVRPSEQWVNGPLILAFHRLWCPFCQQAVKDLQGAEADLAAAGATVALVYRDLPATVASTCSERSTPFACFSDPDRALELAARVPRFRLRRYAAFAPTRLVTALRTGARIGIPKSDLLQGRATYVIDTDGRVRWAHVSATAADIPNVDELLAAVRAAKTAA